MTIRYVSPRGGPAQFEGQTVKTTTLNVAINRTGPGDIVQLVAGIYCQRAIVSTSGTAAHPITIRGTAGAILDGRQPKEAAIGIFEPSDDDFAFFQLQSVSWIVLEDLQFMNCWPSCIFGRGCTDIAVRHCRATGSRFFFYARNRMAGEHHPGIKAKRIQLEGIVWNQDPTQEMWSGRITWSQVKDNSPAGHSYFSGALFGSWDIRGDIVITRCLVSNVFNAVRMDCEPDHALRRYRNLNVRIFDNTFEYVRDNVIEPEQSALNWWVYHNKMRNAHAYFSLHNVSGGFWYFFGNKIWFDSQPGVPGQGNRDGQILKYYNGDPFPAHPVYFFHNSIYTRSPLSKDGETRHLKHYNNALEFCFSGDFCNPNRGFFWTDDSRFRWHATYEFDGDASNHPLYPDGMAPEYELMGRRVDRIFVDGRAGRLELRPDSQGSGAGRPVTLAMPDGSSFTFPAGGNLGAIQPSGLIAVPPYIPYARPDLS